MEAAYLIVAFILSLLPIAALLFAIYATRTSNTLAKRLAALEAEVARWGGVDSPAAPPTATPATPPAGPPPEAAPTPLSPAARPASSAAPAAPELAPSKLEQLIGGIWLQNVGSVLLLLGSFFLILWGYRQGKVGPEVLVLSGVALGGTLGWRGDRIARTIRPLGHALLGVGLGVIYMTVYLGHFRMGVLADWAAFGLLALVSFATIDIGLRRAQAIIAALGIFGAFIPLLLSPETGMGFRLPLPLMIGYLAVANAVVVALTALRGWSGLVIESLILTSVAWLVTAGSGGWSLSIQLGLSVLFTALGLAPVARLVSVPTPVRRPDLAVVALAPMLLLIVSVPFFAASRSETAGALLLGLGAAHGVAAAWADRRRRERDLWRPLTAAAVVFITAAFERLLAKEDLALAWCVEGAVLIWLGMSVRGGWFRALGYGVSALAVLRMLFAPGTYEPGAGPAGVGIVNGNALRDLLCVVSAFVTADRVSRRREYLSPRDRHAPGGWLAAASALLMIWLFRESYPFARLLAPLPSATLAPAPSFHAAPVVSAPITAAAWALQGLVLLFVARWRGSSLHRHVAYAVGLCAVMAFVAVITDGRGWVRGDWIASYPTATIALVAVAIFVSSARTIAVHRSTEGAAFSSGERRAPEVATALANFAILLWTARASGQVADALAPGSALAPHGGDSRSILTAVIMSAGWVSQAGALFAMGWVRRSAYYRWLALSLVGLTLMKFALVDLQRVDVFWRFVIALGIGAMLLLVSFIYQRGKGERNQGA